MIDVLIGLVLLAVGAAAFYGYILYGRMTAKRLEQKFREEQRIKYMSGMKGSFVLKPSKAWNPLKSYPRNLLCFCDSGRKAKACCLPTLNETCNAEHVPQLKALMRNKIDGQAK